MTDTPSDPWKSLANELGVQPGEEKSPAAEPTAPQPPASQSPRVPPRPVTHAPTPPNKSPADWQALAGALGIEIPPEPAAPLARKDPVAELLGFPPPSPDAHSRQEEERRARAESRANYEEDEFEGWDTVRSNRPEPQAEEQSTRNLEGDENSPQIQRSEELRPYRGRGNDSRGDDRYRGGRSRRRGGRGHSRGGSRSEGQDRPRRDQRPLDAERPAFRDTERDSMEVGGAKLPAEAKDTLRPSGDEPTSKDELRHKPRRRGRRGRGSRDRDDRSRRPPAGGGESPMPKASDERIEDELDIDFDPLAEEISPHATGDDLPRPAVPAHGELDEMNEATPDESGGKSSVRDIMTWKDAIGMIIETNLQTRSRSPQNSHPSRGPRGRGGRGGRGRSRGGHR